MQGISGSKRRRSLPETPLSRDSDGSTDENEFAELQEQACRVLLRELGNRVAFSGEGLSLEAVSQLLDGAPSTNRPRRTVGDVKECGRDGSEVSNVEECERDDRVVEEEEDETRSHTECDGVKEAVNSPGLKNGNVCEERGSRPGSKETTIGSEAAAPRECRGSEHGGLQGNGENPSKKARRPSLSVVGRDVADSATTPR